MDDKQPEQDKQTAAEYQAWLDAQARADAWLDEQRNQAYAEAGWRMSGTNYNDGWFSGYRVGR